MVFTLGKRQKKNERWKIKWSGSTGELLLSFAEVGANVVRLKGGDPLVSLRKTISA